MMRVLIVESRVELAQVWAAQLRCEGLEAVVVEDQAGAVRALHLEAFGLMLLDLVLRDGAALAVADYAAFRRPDMPVIFLTDTPVFSDGSIFAHCPNACGFFQSQIPAADLAALAGHYARAA